MARIILMIFIWIFSVLIALNLIFIISKEIIGIFKNIKHEYIEEKDGEETDEPNN